MENLRYFLLVLFVAGVNCSGCSDPAFSPNQRCVRPSNPLEIQRQVSGDQTYTCSDNFVDFTCTKTGRFADLADTTCTWYFECVGDGRGNFLHKYAQCLKYKFSPVLQECTSSYTCPCTYVTRPPSTLDSNWWCNSTTLPIFQCEEAGRFPDLRDSTCSRYFLCSKYHNATWLRTSYACRNSVFDPRSGKCSTAYACPCSTPAPTSTTAAPTTPQGYLCNPGIVPSYVKQFNCKEIGRYPDLDDPECRKYFLCSKLRNDTWVKTRYACSGLGSTFDPTLTKCSVQYKCPCDVTTTTSTPCVPVTTPFECTEKGRFSDLRDVTCKSYYLCSLLRNGTLLRTDYTCSGSAFFDPRSYKCSSEYTCPCSEPTTTPLAVTTPSQCAQNAPDFECTSIGRFPDWSDLECRRYFLCTQYKNGTWVRKSYECRQSTFDPNVKKCSVEYACPCALPTTEPAPTHTTTLSIATTTSYTCAPPFEPLPDFTCKKIGRFPDLADPHCKKYFLCSQLKNGTWIKTRYSCKDSTFAPHEEKCHASYTCPCLTYYTTPLPMGS